MIPEPDSYQGNLFTNSGAADPFAAVFSACRRYRYALWRRWGAGASFVQFIGLNPSTADEFVNDRTLRRCVNFAKDWNYDGLCMTNLFAWRDTKPVNMKAAAAPVGEANDEWLLRIADRCELIVAAWGKDGNFLGRAATVEKLIPKEMKCLGFGKNGAPLHPLYQPATRVPLPFRAG